VPGHPHILAGQLVENLKAQAAPYHPTYLLEEPVTHLQQGPDGTFTLTRAGGQKIMAKVVILAGGGGMFAPRKPTGLDNLSAYEESGAVSYAVTQKAKFAGQTLVLAGGGDSALDWAVELAGIATHVHLVHRRPDFRAAEATVQKMQALVGEGKITLHTPFQLNALNGTNSKLESVTLADLEGQTRTVQATQLVCCFGLQPQAGAIATWGLGLDKGLIPVNRATMETPRKGVLCIGDMADYEGKVALILTGFAEAAVAAKTCQAIINPEKKYKVQYSTSKGVPSA
jgi:thioredoxin reductase (NADPH)